VHPDPSNVIGHELDLAGVKASPYLQVTAGGCLSDGLSAMDGPAGAVERGQDPISSRPYEPSPEQTDSILGVTMMPVEEGAPSPIAHCQRTFCGGDDVSEEHSGEHTITCQMGPMSRDEAFHLVQHLGGLTRIREKVIATDL
jgi:hypothetical protein